MTAPLNCARCGEPPTIDDSLGWWVDCRECQDIDCDGERYHHTAPYGVGVTKDAAVASWNDATEMETR